MSSEVTQEQLDGLGARFDKGFDELKALLRSFDDRMRSIELQQARTHSLINRLLHYKISNHLLKKK